MPDCKCLCPSCEDKNCTAVVKYTKYDGTEEKLPDYHGFIRCQNMWKESYVDMLYKRNKWRVRAIVGCILAIAAIIKIFF